MIVATTAGGTVVFRPRECYTADGHLKVRFSSKREAKAAARNMPGRLTPYRCPYCPGWHLGNQRSEAER